jgi:hypothetical protein
MWVRLPPPALCGTTTYENGEEPAKGPPPPRLCRNCAGTWHKKAEPYPWAASWIGTTDRPSSSSWWSFASFATPAARSSSFTML